MGVGSPKSMPLGDGYNRRLLMGTKTDQVERSIREIVETEQGPNGQLPSERELAAPRYGSC
jgi:hypothetical protein